MKTATYQSLLIFPISIVFFKTFEILGICFYADMHRKDNTANNSNNSQSNKKLRKYRHGFLTNYLNIGFIMINEVAVI